MALGMDIVPGVSVTGASQITVASGTEMQFNDHSIEGHVSLAVGDRLMTGGIEVHFISVES